jgi:E3 ubiquitin-protein ligase RNF146
VLDVTWFEKMETTLATEELSEEDLECAVCLQTSVHPVKLPCQHIFCFLCVKGVTVQSRRCPMCRREIPQSYLEHPNLVKDHPAKDHHHIPPEPQEASAVQDNSTPDDDDDDSSNLEYRWYYQGRNGWWEYDERTAQELEHHFKKGDKNCELLIAGFLYCVDFENMLQCRRNEPQRRRQIKRDLTTNVVDKKGVAGIRIGIAAAQPAAPAVAGQAADDLVDQVSNLTLAAGGSAPSMLPRQPVPTLRNLVDLGAAAGAAINISDDQDDDDSDNNNNNEEDDDDDDDDGQVVL